jgi:uncharacterized protein (DUF2141 family)
MFKFHKRKRDMSRAVIKHLIIILLVIVLPIEAQTTKESAVDSTGAVQIFVTGFRSDDGVARIAMFRGKKGFPNDSSKAYWKGISEIDNRVAKILLSAVKYDTYAISVYHDANRNGKLDRKWRIIPKEGFGSSNNTREEKQGPTYAESSFVIDSDSTYIDIEIEYLFGR